MGENRAGLGLDDENDKTEEQIDIEDLTGRANQKPKPTPAIQEALAEAGAAHGFVSRPTSTKKPRQRSPYVIQKNIKMRIGMPELLVKLTAATGAGSDQEALERAILALIEKHGLEDLKTEYVGLTE